MLLSMNLRPYRLNSEVRLVARLPDSVIFLFAVALQSIAPFATAPVLTRELAKEGFGAVVSALAAAAIIAIGLHLQIPAVVSREVVSESNTRFKTLNRTASILTICTGGCLCVLAAAVGGSLWCLAAANAIPLSLGQIVMSDARARMRPYRFALAIFAVIVLPTIVGTTAAAVSSSAEVYLLASFLTGTATALWLLFPILCTVGPSFPRGSVSLLLRSVALVPHAVAMSVALVGARLAVSSYGGSDAAAEFQVAYLVGAVPTLLLYAVNNSWSVTILRASPTQVNGLCRRFIVGALLGSIVWACLTQLLLPQVLRVLAPTYMPADVRWSALLLTAQGILTATYLTQVNLCMRERTTTFLSWLSPSCVAVGLIAASVLADQAPVFAGAVGSSLILALLSISIRVGRGHGRKSFSSRRNGSNESVL